jgi:putative intracellular protease/amidase
MKNGAPHPTGFWAEEFIEPHKKFTAAGFRVTVATPEGVVPTPDPLSFAVQYNNNDPGKVTEQKAYLKAHEGFLNAPLKLKEARAASFDVIFVVGGHGPMQDLAVDPFIGPLLAAMLQDTRKIVAAVCHGPASFLSATQADGTWLFKNRELVAFTNEEETAATFAGNAPWLLEDRLRLAGARFTAKAAWSSHVVTDGNLITGQNQVSAKAAGEAVAKRFAT